ncbi:hypothetical protein [Capillimicrobium parvum]|uniref:DUF4190 domain-containing protein n=1 Tax=Capillimicrobium parvum TaxID=2884022 RepID=A0A9E6XYQ0_9ACTN|nr:hypothetical protein [Capillimicrobium parvum]UGS36261.1 hypothetical protein DSM104329_02662 [Capillimicrobium parvum]
MGEEGEQPRFLPPTADPPDYRRAPLPPPAPRAAAAPPPAGRARIRRHPPPVPGRNYSAADPGLPAARTDEIAPPAVAEPSNPLAVWSISLGVIGLLLLISFFGVIVVNVPLSIAAWITGAKARDRPGQSSMAQAGMITGIVGTSLGAVALVIWGVGVALTS